MAEGGASATPDKLKPVPPPKPSCSPTRPKFEESSEPALHSRSAVHAFFEYPDQRTKTHLKGQSGKSDNTCSESTSLKQFKKGATLPYKPPILPKPTASFIRGLRVKALYRDSHQKQLSSNHKEEISRHKQLVISTIESNFHELKTTRTVSVEKHTNLETKQEDSSVTNLVSPLVPRAPVAKLDEFENFLFHLNPIRPPRSPKNKTGDPFAKCDTTKPVLPAKKKHLVDVSGQVQKSLGPCNYGKSMSLNRTDALIFSEIQSKYSSSGRSTKQVINDCGTSNTYIKCSPIPPPRRRRRSDPNPSQEHAESLSSYVPVYAQVNYSLKKNRRGQLRSSVSVDPFLLHQGVKDECPNQVNPSAAESLADPCIISSGYSAELSNKLSVESNNSEAQLGAAPDYEDNHFLQSGKLNETGTLLSDNTPIVDNLDCSDNLVIKEDKDVDNGIIVFGLQGDKRETNNSTVDHCLEPKEAVDKCSDTCADCLSTHILELVCDDSVSSSKLDWQSARSSFNSCNDSTLSSGSSCSLIVSEPVDEQFTNVNDDTQSKIGTLHSSSVMEEDTVDMRNNGLLKLVQPSKDEGSIIEKDTCNIVLDENSAQINNKINVNSCSDHSCKISNREMCSSFKNGNGEGMEHTSSDSISSDSSRRCSRRWSWGCSNDFPDWLKVKLSNTLRFYEKDLKREISPVETCVDNTQRHSSVEDKKIKERNSSHVGRKLLVWWGSFGKGSKKYARHKRLSQFYCEQEASEFQDHSPSHPTRKLVSSVSSPIDGLSSSVPVLKGVLSREDFSKISFHQVSETSDNMCCDNSIQGTNMDIRNESVVPVNSFELNQHSDSEGEDASCNFSTDASQSMTANERIEKKAFYIAKELMTSERVFIDVLKLLNINFRQAVEKAGGESVIPEIELCRIINSLPQLQRLNEDLLRDLEQRIENWTSLRKIADVIVKKGPFLKLYTTYIQNFEAQCNYFDECCQKYPKFAKVVKDFEASPICQKLSIKHFMLKPVQRIPQYRLLLDDYARNLDPSSPDFEDTQTALRIVSDVAEHANRSIKLGDHLSKLLQLQSRLGNYEIIKPGRMVLKEGELLKLSRKDRQPRYFILLNDCLLYTTYYGSGPSSGFKVNAELPLTGMKVTTPQAEDYHNEFSIISSTRSFTLSGRSLNERQEWVDTLQKAIQDHVSRQLSFQNRRCKLKTTEGSSEPFQLGREAPVWIQDGRVTKCQSCVAEFTVTFRRHHCRACGKVVCGDCSDFRAPLQYMKFQAARVCEECFKTLLNEFENPDNMFDEIIKKELGECTQDTFNNIKSHFKRLGLGSGRKTRKYIPQRLLEVTANDADSQISGWLQRRSKRSWKRLWFVLKDQVLYAYKASEDVVALQTIPVLGYAVEQISKKNLQLYEGIDAKCVFQLTHPGQPPLVFSADSENIASRWISTLQDATILK